MPRSHKMAENFDKTIFKLRIQWKYECRYYLILQHDRFADLFSRRVRFFFNIIFDKRSFQVHDDSFSLWNASTARLVWYEICCIAKRTHLYRNYQFKRRSVSVCQLVYRCECFDDLNIFHAIIARIQLIIKVRISDPRSGVRSADVMWWFRDNRQE